MTIKRIVIWFLVMMLGGAYAIMVVGCASTKIKRLSGEEFVKHAGCVDRLGSFTWETYIGVSHQRAYLEYGHPAFIGKATITTIYWTPLEDLPINLASQLKAGAPPWTNWMNFEHSPIPQ